MTLPSHLEHIIIIMIHAIQNPLIYLIVNPKWYFNYEKIIRFSESYYDPEDTSSWFIDDKNVYNIYR